MTQSGSTKELDKATLQDAIEAHCVKERASFHTPGHKGGTHFKCGQNLWAMDVTELPGLDELAYANGVLAGVQERAAKAFGATASFISTNGASAALMAAIIACAGRGSHVLLPRNVHRSAISALVLTGLEPIWYEPQFDADWQVWGAVEAESIANAVAKYASKLAAAVVVSPTYSGAISALKRISILCHAEQIPLIVDEAHGSHAPHAVASGADITVHSLHKTLSAMTQTGLIHVGKKSLIETDEVRLALNMVQSSSPNYVLMASVDAAISEFADGKRIEYAGRIAEEAHQKLRAEHIPSYRSPQHDSYHLLVRLPGTTAEQLFDGLVAHGVYPECVLGDGVLLLFGCGSTSMDVDLLANALAQLRSNSCAGTKHPEPVSLKPGVYGKQVLSPKLAYFGKTEIVSLADAAGRIAAECVAPCPPGNPVVVPGQLVTAGALQLCRLPALRVVLASPQGEN